TLHDPGCDEPAKGRHDRNHPRPKRRGRRPEQHRLARGALHSEAGHAVEHEVRNPLAEVLEYDGAEPCDQTDERAEEQGAPDRVKLEALGFTANMAKRTHSTSLSKRT